LGLRRKRLTGRVGALVRRVARKFDFDCRVLLASGRVVRIDGALLPDSSAGKVADGALGLKGVWVFPLEGWLELGDVGSAFTISGAGSVWTLDFGASVVLLPEFGLARVECLRVIGRRD